MSHSFISINVKNLIAIFIFIVHKTHYKARAQLFFNHSLNHQSLMSHNKYFIEIVKVSWMNEAIVSKNQNRFNCWLTVVLYIALDFQWY